LYGFTLGFYFKMPHVCIIPDCLVKIASFLSFYSLYIQIFIVGSIYTKIYCNNFSLYASLVRWWKCIDQRMCVFNKLFFPPLQCTDPIVMKSTPDAEPCWMLNFFVHFRFILNWVLAVYSWYCNSDNAVGWTIEEIEYNFWQAKEIFLFLQSIQASSGAHPVSYSVGIRSEAAGFV
jgi:hypothetical protein